MFAVEATTIPPELVSTICSNCGYALEGLPTNVVCPECGREQRPTEIVLYGWARGSHERDHNAKPSRLVWVLLGGNLWWIINVVLYRGLLGKVYLFLGGVPLIWMLFRRKDSLKDGKVQVRLNCAGCVQYDSTSGRSQLQEMFFAYGWLLVPLPMGILLLWVRTQNAIDNLVLFWTLFVSGAIITPIWWYTSRHFRAARRVLADNSMIDSNAIYHKVIPWSGIDRFTLEKSSAGRYRLQIVAKGGYGIFRIGWNIVDAEVELVEENESLLRQQMYAWLGRPRKA
jgi:hypothetical protein